MGMGPPVIISSMTFVCLKAGRWPWGQHQGPLARRGGVWKSRSSVASQLGPATWPRAESSAQAPLGVNPGDSQVSGFSPVKRR